MEAEKNQADPTPGGAVKAIGDLDDLVRAVRTSIPSAKPWQRQLLAYLADVDQRTQVLRMTLVMKRGDDEVAEAAEKLRISLRIAQRYVSTGRADLGTRAAVLLAFELGTRIDAALP